MSVIQSSILSCVSLAEKLSPISESEAYAINILPVNDEFYQCWMEKYDSGKISDNSDFVSDIVSDGNTIEEAILNLRELLTKRMN